MMLDLHMPAWRKNKVIRSHYKYYKYKKDKSHPDYVTKKQFTDIIRDFFLLLEDHLIEGKIYYPPYGMGEFRVTKHKIANRDNLTRNWALEKKYHEEHGVWKKLYTHNFHTDGYRFKLRWFIKGYNKIPVKKVYRFSTNVFYFKRKLAKYLLSTGDSERYHTVTSNTRTKTFKTLI